MLVRELIEKLSECPSEAEVQVNPIIIDYFYTDQPVKHASRYEILKVQVGPKRYPNLVFIGFKSN